MRAVAIFAPLVTAAGLALGWYKKRGVLLNPWKREKYDKGEKTVPINTPFNCSFEAPKDKIRLVQAFNGQRMFLGLPAPKNLDDRGWLEWMKFDQPITGGNLLPSWLTYEEGDNELISSLGPNQKDLGLYTIRVYGSGEVILEEIRLKVGDQSEDGTELTARRAAKDPSQSMAPLLDDESTA